MHEGNTGVAVHRVNQQRRQLRENAFIFLNRQLTDDHAASTSDETGRESAPMR